MYIYVYIYIYIYTHTHTQTLPDDQAKINLVNPVMYFAAGCAWMPPPPLPGTGTSNILLVLLMF